MRDPEPAPEPDDLTVRLAWPGTGVRWAPPADDAGAAALAPTGNGLAAPAPAVPNRAEVIGLEVRVRRLRLAVAGVLVAWLLTSAAAVAALLAAS